MAKQKSTNSLQIFALPKIASTTDAMAQKNVIASIVDAISGDCWTYYTMKNKLGYFRNGSKYLWKLMININQVI